MAMISAAGVGSGLDVESIVTQLMKLERQPIDALQTKKSGCESKLSSLGQVKSALSAIQTALAKLRDAATFSATTASVADKALLAATSSASATPGSYSVQVDQLAKAQRVASSASSEPTVAAGSLTIALGTLSGGSFTADGARTTTINLAAGSTLEELRDAINDAEAGVTARVIDNGTVKQFVLTSDETGEDQAFSVSGSGGLAGFGFDPAAPGAGSLSSIQTAQDARLIVDGIAVTRPDNTVTDVIEGTTLTLKAETTTPTSLTVDQDQSVAQKAVEEFVSAYNSAVGTIRNLSSYDPATKKAGALNGENGMRALASHLRDVFTLPLSGLDGAKSLSEIGLSFGLDGTISVDSTKLGAALADPTKNVAELFGGNGTVSGYADLLDSELDECLGSTGMIASRSESLTTLMKGHDDRIAALELRMDAVEARYRAQYSALDSMMASMNQTASYLTQQLNSFQ